MDDLFPADEESVEVVMKEKENAGEDQCKQERNLKDVVSVHVSETGLTVELFFPGSMQRRDTSAPCPFAGTELPYKLTKGPAIVKQDILKLPTHRMGLPGKAAVCSLLRPLSPPARRGLRAKAPGQTKQLTPDFRL
jgi:hypothetical protein